MRIRQWWQREKYVALHAQTVRFRIIKYVILGVLLLGIFLWKGGPAVLEVLGFLFVFALIVHFLFRWKTKAWTRSWGPYKAMEIPKF